MILLILSFLIAINCVNSVTIDCRTQSNVWTPFGTLKECLTYEVVSDENDREVTEVKTSEDPVLYQSFYIYESLNCFYFPKGLTKYFSIDLQTIIVAHSGLKVITKEDLEPFKNLKGLYIDFCYIKRLNSDLFLYTPYIEQLSFQKDEIEYVEPGTFSPLTKLTSFSFDDNKCHNGREDGMENIQSLIIEIEENCEPLEIRRSSEEITDDDNDSNEGGLKDNIIHAYERTKEAAQEIKEKESPRKLWTYVILGISAVILICVIFYLKKK